MPESERYDTNAIILETLMQKVSEDPYPSTTMLNLIEELLTPETRTAYAEFLSDRITNDQFPSIPMINRLHNLA